MLLTEEGLAPLEIRLGGLLLILSLGGLCYLPHMLSFPSSLSWLALTDLLMLLLGSLSCSMPCLSSLSLFPNSLSLPPSGRCGVQGAGCGGWGSAPFEPLYYVEQEREFLRG